MRHHTAAPFFGDPGGTQNPLKNVMKIRCSKRGPKSAPWGSLGSLGEPPGAQMRLKREPEGSQKRSKNGVFPGSDEKARNVSKPQYVLCFRHISHPRKRLFWATFNVPNRGRNREATKRSQKRSKIVAGRVRSGPGAENWSQQGSKRGPKRLPK